MTLVQGAYGGTREVHDAGQLRVAGGGGVQTVASGYFGGLNGASILRISVTTYRLLRALVPFQFAPAALTSTYIIRPVLSHIALVEERRRHAMSECDHSKSARRLYLSN